ncbi:MAG: hypothetical protein VX916_06915 [Planctomycetota bacterium]|nr:hypothetical protein [Planctomycetota bacterium]
MTILLFFLAVLTTQAFILGTTFWGELTPDPLVPLLAWFGLWGGIRNLLPSALALGWGRALVVLEPVGVVALGVFATLLVVRRKHPVRTMVPIGTLFVATVVTAATLGVIDLCMEWIFHVSLVTWPGLAMGMGLVFPLRLVFRFGSRRTGWMS